ncbi:hypothetical protein DNX69_11130 [Rhodopseudomonas palustris]|uniref:Uncharacterized protein n=1 Tax=Rhodopseudomonas palustris TaxID=1076 RepID=A0A323UHP3_RHOPL|nr:hypothetical protein DNX69_11130 [Rhodopseudomonas palustris]
MITFAAQLLMEMSVRSLTSARHSKTTPERPLQRNCYRDEEIRGRDSRAMALRGCATAATSSEF